MVKRDKMANKPRNSWPPDWQFWLQSPGIVNRTQSNLIERINNRTQSISIELNPWIEFDWVRQSNENRTPNFVWVRFPNQSNSIEQIEFNRTQSNAIHCHCHCHCQSLSIEHNPMDCVRKFTRWLRAANLYTAVSRKVVGKKRKSARGNPQWCCG